MAAKPYNHLPVLVLIRTIEGLDLMCYAPPGMTHAHAKWHGHKALSHSLDPRFDADEEVEYVPVPEDNIIDYLEGQGFTVVNWSSAQHLLYVDLSDHYDAK